MDFATALKTIPNAESVGGQLIVNYEGRNVLVGKNVQGVLIVEETTEAKLVLGLDPSVPVDPDAPINPPEPAPEPKTHEVKVDDKVETKDNLKK